MKNYRHDGNVMDLIAPVDGVVSGNAYLMGDMMVVALNSALEGESFRGHRRGVFELPIASGESPSEGAIAYWHNSSREFSTISTDGVKAGFFVHDDSGDVLVLLTGV
ncbi:DUF2190 family protein [Pleionea sediminis]|uniref:DUF2190 family protein n=1 Tax=Pleionea sediminis TaxID=2569479 RepID=UPI0011861356|nr:capsid cement protein [Pleionea sediminis]